MAGGSTRAEIVAAADRLFYEQGYEHTSFADIAGAVQISRGNFYYYFKTKDEILDAVIAVRLENTGRMLDAWAADSAAPADRIRSFIDILIMNRVKIQAHGCPVGTLCNELAKLDHPALGAARALLLLFQDWLARQFVALGCADEADALALHLLARTQGVATLANALKDEAFLRREVGEMNLWLSLRCEEIAACSSSR
ncbi:TetR/AcrR family transcriptional regulator [Xanthobacter oligotrophicus]|uniref:TetR/AcrR family transcriptional regulator n=1 Tax=Xanthobacter oligotrophicus TaxID=2607286 RepID=UPI0011F19793|nr:helix-turn-helix domain-containing protein [Xanthobacter oligotrophicus]MCG5237242.1 TetR/AcrR family transcriptional regulator [Xanthobacter oligotrophicus]